MNIPGFRIELNHRTIKVLRQVMGISRTELAQASNMSKQTIASMEIGRRNVTKLSSHRLMRGFRKWYTDEEIFVFNALIDMKSGEGDFDVTK